MKNDGTFKPQEYGQDDKFAVCPFKRSIEILSGLNTTTTPFEVASILQKTHRQIAEEFEEFALSLGMRDVPINGDIVIASLMTAFIHAGIEHPIEKMLYIQHFSYIAYNISEVGIFAYKSIIGSIYGGQFRACGREFQTYAVHG